MLAPGLAGPIRTRDYGVMAAAEAGRINAG